MASVTSSYTSADEIPLLIYGTGSCSEKQDELTFKAVQQGYLAIDTGPTPAYCEELTSRGLQQATLTRPGQRSQSLFVQTKISPADRYQDINALPFEISDCPRQQVIKSFQRSKLRFAGSGCNINALLLHAPLPTFSMTIQYWEAMEYLVDSEEHLKLLGICNATIATVRHLHSTARIKPSIVQNSFRAPSHFDRDVIDFCRETGMIYQAYGVLTSNVELLSSQIVGWFAETNSISEAEALILLVASFGRGTIRIIHASHDEEHMASDLANCHLVNEVTEAVINGFEELLGVLSRSSPRGISWSY
ncbi:putative Aldo-keto reductase [Seiridium cardinale]|uniref:Aldo-keto reductase n=1 Tax=Seiridium cardinale TaxID=138064 RepID=A0ABR2Y559_9PEZI